MKVVDYYWDHPDLKVFTKKCVKGTYLFRQGEEGRSMYILVQGVAELVAEKKGKELVVGMEESGHFLGESAVTSETGHRRVFGARARTDLVYLELTWKDVEAFAKKNPTMMLDIMKRMFQLAAERLAQANRLAEVLRSSKNIERLVRLILHFGQSSTARKTAKGTQVMINTDRIRYYIDMSDFEIEECFKELERRKILVRDTGEFYYLKNDEALLNSVPLLKEALPALTAI